MFDDAVDRWIQTIQSAYVMTVICVVLIAGAVITGLLTRSGPWVHRLSWGYLVVVAVAGALVTVTAQRLCLATTEVASFTHDLLVNGDFDPRFRDAVVLGATEVGQERRVAFYGLGSRVEDSAEDNSIQSLTGPNWIRLAVIIGTALVVGVTGWRIRRLTVRSRIYGACSWILAVGLACGALWQSWELLAITSAASLDAALHGPPR